MAGETQDVDPQRVHVDGEHAGALRDVHHEDGARLARRRPDRSEVLDRAEHVRSVVDDHDPGPGTQRIADRLGVHVALGVAPDPRDLHPVIAFEVVERAQHGIMFDPAW